MQNNTSTRKRPAPGTSPLPPQQNMQNLPSANYPYQSLPDNTTGTTNDFNNFDFSAPLPTADPTFSDAAAPFDRNAFNYALNAQQPQPFFNPSAPAQATSTDLVRRARNQQLAPQNNKPQEQWNGHAAVNPQLNSKVDPEEEDEQDLDMKVALAKKDAQGKRKNILPFVQKLSSFLDSNNTDLIRWSDDGRSFIVLDEDEFARTLIPEVFKHNNYASFVRQLNMYGFHKTVNITDGSLRQSEKARKGVKPPSMYSHPYFRRNRPDLLWLVQKPANGNKATKRKRDGAKDGYDSDEGRPFSPLPESGPQQLSAPGTSSQDLAQLPRNELAAVRRELQNLQTQQKFISQMITQLKEQNDTFYRQASTFQALHDRHENSINAILTFLATFYRQGLEGHGAQNLVNMFTNMPTQNQQSHGSVVEEYNDGTSPTPTNQVQRFVKRPPLLLPGPAASESPQNPANLQPGTAVTEPSSARASATPPTDTSKRESTTRNTQSSNATTPTVKPEVQTPNNDQMMNMINTANATTQAGSTASSSTPTAASAVDMNSIVDKINASNSPLTAQQRDDMVNSVLGSNANNALTSFKAAETPQQWQQQLDQSHSALDYLQQLQRQQDDKVQELNRRLQPLSPTGSIPGLHNGNGGAWDDNTNPFDAAQYDLGAFIDFDQPQPWEQQGGEAGDAAQFDFGGFGAADGDGGANGWDADFAPQLRDGAEGQDDMFGTATFDDGTAGNGYATVAGGGDGRVESVSTSEATSPAGAHAGTGEEEAGGVNKRARLS